MSSGLPLAVLLVALLAALMWLLGWPKRAGDDSAETEDDAETRAAEEEVRDVDSFASPDEAEEELRDWGPGTHNP